MKVEEKFSVGESEEVNIYQHTSDVKREHYALMYQISWLVEGRTGTFTISGLPPR